LINEKAGVVNLGAEGMMLCAAIAGFATVVHTGSDMLGFAAGMLAGAVLLGFVGLLLAVPLTAVIGVLAKFAIRRYLQSGLYLEH
jgi:ABC-type uncharacterized transport system permease subunit